MLEGVDAISWSDIHGPYGTVADMPHWLHEAASPDPSIAGAGLGHIWDNTIHQGTRWESSAAVIPFLFELLRVPATLHRQGIAWGVQALAIDEVVPLFPSGVDPEKLFPGAAQITLDPDEVRTIWNTQDWDTLTEHQWRVADLMPLRWHYDTYQAVERQLPAACDLINDPDPGVRLAMGRAPTYFPKVAVQALPHLRSALESANDSTHLATIAMSLGFAGRYSKDNSDAEHLQSLLAAEHPRIVQVAAALSLGTLLGPAMPGQAVDLLMEFTGEDMGVIASYTTSLQLPSSLLGYVWQMLHSLGL